ncbi:MAG: ATP-binding cassette domain-containing protein [Planctomycetota bacterium]
MFELLGVTKDFGATQVLASITLRTEACATTVLIGPSGCGKSTLLRLMIGLVLPDRGELRFADQKLDPARILRLRQRMGYVIQDGGLFPHLTAEKNVSLMARHLGWDTLRISRRLEELCELTHFPGDGLDRFPVQLSGGQCQRVSLMRALMLDPDVLLLDEPLGALDPMIRAELQQDLKAIFQKLQKTVVLVTHDIGEAAFFGDTCILLRGGRIVQQGSFSSLYREPSEPFVTTFIRAQMRSFDSLLGEEESA